MSTSTLQANMSSKHSCWLIGSSTTKRGNVMHVHPLNNEICTFPKKMKVTYWIQKNRQNGQSTTLVSDDDHPDICPVCAAYRIFLRAKCLGQSNSQPMAIFVNKHGDTKYLMGNKISDVLRSIARVVHPDLSEDEIKRLSLHSGWVWALVLLDEAGMSPDFMKSCLCWMGESYRLYLRDMSVLQQNLSMPLKRTPTTYCDSLVGIAISYQTLSQITMKWENTKFM